MDAEFIFTWVDRQGQLRVSYLDDEDSTKYIRADIADDMLAALEAVREWSSTSFNTQHDNFAHLATVVLPAVTAAIAKAKGEAT